jgi:hypothetical protein
MKMQTVVWEHSRLPAKKKFKVTMARGNMIAKSFWNICWFIHIDFMLCCMMVTAFAYQVI